MTEDTDGFTEWEQHIHAFVARAAPYDAPMQGPLTGLTIGVKDIIDVAGLPTGNGSATCARVAPAAQDAAVVATLRAAGARILGKTVTTEFAFTDPTDCRNPHDLTRSPGGSSSGSGAAVAAGLVDIALGTQTAGSLCRPAAYCGVVGLKPTYGTLPMAGVTPLAPSFDTMGLMAPSVCLVQAAFEVLVGRTDRHTVKSPNVCQWLLPDGVKPARATQTALEEAAEALTRGVPTASAPEIECAVADIVAAHRCVMVAEAVQAHGHLLLEPTQDLLRPKFRAGLEAGAALTASEVETARSCLAKATIAFWESWRDTDVILTLPVPDGAPRLGDSTGFQDWLTPWTVFGGPLVTIPWGCDEAGRPRAVMLAGKPGADWALLELAETLEQMAPPRPVPQLPKTALA